MYQGKKGGVMLYSKYKTIALLAAAGALISVMSGCVVHDHHVPRPGHYPPPQGHRYPPKPGHRYKPLPQGHRPPPPHHGPFGQVELKIFDNRDRTA